MSIQTRPREDLTKMLDENHHLILQIADLQNKGRATDCHIVQKHLLKNLLYLGTLANNQVKKEELLLSPSTRSNLRESSKTAHVATLPTTNLDAENCLKPNEALPGAAQHKARVVTAAPPKTPVIVGPAHPRRLHPTLVQAPHPRQWVRVEVPGNSNAAAEPLLKTSQVTGTDLFSQRSFTAQILPPTSAIPAKDTTRIQVVPELSTHVTQPTGQTLQLLNQATASSFSRSSAPITVPISSNAGQTHVGTGMPLITGTSSATQVQQYIATMTPQGMVFVPLRTSP